MCMICVRLAAKRKVTEKLLTVKVSVTKQNLKKAFDSLNIAYFNFVEFFLKLFLFIMLSN